MCRYIYVYALLTLASVAMTVEAGPGALNAGGSIHQAGTLELRDTIQGFQSLSQTAIIASGTQAGHTLTLSGGQLSSAIQGVPFDTAPVNTSLPTITGTPTVGETLTANAGGWNDDADGGTVTLSLYWQRKSDGATWVDIAGATGLSYALSASDGGCQVRVRVLAANSDGPANAQATSSHVTVAALGHSGDNSDKHRICGVGTGLASLIMFACLLIGLRRRMDGP